MGVYIKGMEMPTEQYGKMVITLYPNGHVAEYVGDIGRVWEAVPVPPHGRLIDANKIGLTDFEIILCQKGNPFKNALEMLLEKIENAPTIIPAEEGET